MTKFLRFEAAKGSPVYQTIIADAVDRLMHVGGFSKDEVLDATGYNVFDDNSIRWDYVKRIIEEDHDTDLIPMASVYFKVNQRNGRKDRRHGAAFPPTQFPERYIATGNGKKTAGYVIASDVNGHFVVQRLKITRGHIQGKIKRGNRSLEIGKRAGIRRLKNEDTLLIPPPLKDKDDD